MRNRISNYIRAGYSGLYLISPEEQRVQAEFKSIADALGFKLYAWSITSGLIQIQTGETRDCSDPLEILSLSRVLPEKSILLLQDYHLFLGPDPNPLIIRQFRDVLLEAKTKSKVLVVLGCRLQLPPELEREVAVVEFALPGKEELRTVLDGILESAVLGTLEQETLERALDAASGLTTTEAENAFALSIVETKVVEPTLIAREKALAIQKSGILEVIETAASLETIGGLDELKHWLTLRKHAFGQKARDFGLPYPKGLLIVGIPGTGKSLTAKATAAVFGTPLLKLDMGRIFGGLVGQSEANLRQVIQTAEAMAPCVLWLDEIEKGFSGTKSSGATDGGTTSRVFGSFLSWMQEKQSPVFVVATANDVTQLPPEMLRKGRFDELFWIDLPHQEERTSIWSIQIGRYGRNPKEFDLVQLSKATEGFTGSEIESAFVEALYQAFESEQDLSDLSIAQVLTGFIPLSQLMSEQITALRQWAKGRARRATSPAPERKLRKLVA